MSDHDQAGPDREAQDHSPCSGAPHLTCREISEFLLAYLERDLDGEAAAEFERHLQLCPPCGHYLDSYRETIELVRRCGRSEADPVRKREHAPPEGLIQAILAATAASKSDS